MTKLCLQTRLSQLITHSQSWKINMPVISGLRVIISHKDCSMGPSKGVYGDESFTCMVCELWQAMKWVMGCLFRLMCPMVMHSKQYTLTSRYASRPYSCSLTRASTISNQDVACVTTVGGCLFECCSSSVTNLPMDWVCQCATVHNCWNEKYIFNTWYCIR